MVSMRNLFPTPALAAVAICAALFTPAFTPSAHAQTQPLTLPLWPHGTPEPPQTTEPETDVTKPTDHLIDGHRTARLTNVTVPTLTVYPPHGTNTGAAA